MKKYKMNHIQKIYLEDNIFFTLNCSINILNELNNYLATILPNELKNFCHFGAIDKERNMPVLFIINQNVAHIIKTFTDQILHKLLQNHHNFTGIIFKIKVTPSKQHIKQTKILDDTQKMQLLKLTNLIK